jgi:hypothetical protein
MVFTLLWISMVLGVSTVSLLVLEVLRDNWLQAARVPANRRWSVWEDDCTIARKVGLARIRPASGGWSGFMPARLRWVHATMSLFCDLGYRVARVKSNVFRERREAG